MFRAGFLLITVPVAGEGKVANYTLLPKTSAQSDTHPSSYISLAPCKSEAKPNFNGSEKYNPTIRPEANRKYLVKSTKDYQAVILKTVIKY